MIRRHMEGITGIRARLRAPLAAAAVRWRPRAEWLALAATAVLALHRTYVGFYSLLFGTRVQSAADILSRWSETRRWFAGQPVYGVVGTAIYPPTTYALLWPLIGWWPAGAVRWLCAAAMAASLVGLIALLIRASGAASRREMAFWALAVPAAQSTSNLVAGGQLALPVLVLGFAGVLLVRGRPRAAGGRLAAALLALVALAKPTITAPFVWLFVFGAEALWPAGVVVLGYAAATAVAARVQPAGIGTEFAAWLEAARHATATLGYGNVQRWLDGWGLGNWAVAASLALFAGFGVWVAWRRREDTLFLAGVAALLARFWTYHQGYDDVLLLVPVAFLWRAAGGHELDRRLRLVAGLTCAWAWFALLAPLRFLLLPDSAEPALDAVRTASWLAVLAVTLAVGRTRRIALTAQAALPVPARTAPGR